MSSTTEKLSYIKEKIVMQLMTHDELLRALTAEREVSDKLGEALSAIASLNQPIDIVDVMDVRARNAVEIAIDALAEVARIREQT